MLLHDYKKLNFSIAISWMHQGAQNDNGPTSADEVAEDVAQPCTVFYIFPLSHPCPLTAASGAAIQTYLLETLYSIGKILLKNH